MDIVQLINKYGFPIVAAGGEYVIHPDTVKQIGGGSIEKGHEFLDHFVKGVRKNLIKKIGRAHV